MTLGAYRGIVETVNEWYGLRHSSHTAKPPFGGLPVHWPLLTLRRPLATQSRSSRPMASPSRIAGSVEPRAPRRD